MTPEGRLMRDLRESRGIEQCRLADEIHMPASHLSAIELGVRAPLSPGKRALFAEVLKLSPGEIAQLDAARSESRLRFRLSPRLSPLHIKLANRFHQRLAQFTPEHLRRIENALDAHTKGVRPSRAAAR